MSAKRPVGGALIPQDVEELPPAWEDLANSWLIHLKAENKSPKTVALYDRGVRMNLLPYLVQQGWTGSFGNAGELINQWLVTLQADGRSGATRSAYRAGVASFYAWLKTEGEIQSNPFAERRIARPRAEEKLTAPLTPEDMGKLFKAAKLDRYYGPRSVAILSLLYDSGLRVSELTGLTLDDVDMVNWTLAVRRAKGGHPRIVSFGKLTARDLDRYLRWRRAYKREHLSRWAPDSDALFIGRTGADLTPTGIRNFLRQMGELAGISGRLHPHRLRHASAAAFFDAGGREADARHQFGWSQNSDMPAHYSRNGAEERARQAHRQLSPGDKISR